MKDHDTPDITQAAISDRKTLRHKVLIGSWSQGKVEKYREFGKGEKAHSERRKQEWSQRRTTYQDGYKVKFPWSDLNLV